MLQLVDNKVFIHFYCLKSRAFCQKIIWPHDVSISPCANRDMQPFHDDRNGRQEIFRSLELLIRRFLLVFRLHFDW